jgi:hypothetical protein
MTLWAIAANSSLLIVTSVFVGWFDGWFVGYRLMVHYMIWHFKKWQ